MSLYTRLAWDGIRKNGRLYLPYILTCVGMVTMYYMMSELCASDLLRYMKGGGASHLILGLGSWVIAVFSALFLYYTYSFLIRRRQKEFGLYHVLGLGKRHIALLCVIETAMTAMIALVAGLAIGVGVSFAAELGLRSTMEAELDFHFSVNRSVVLQTVLVYLAIFALTLLSTLVKIGRGTAMSLLHSESYGEKPPKGNLFVAILGAVLLAAAYVMAVSIQEPLKALGMFFIAVILVILATYLLFIAGSVALCRMLQRNRNYYYQPRHFVSVSSMAYRMKRNGAGLASICILATMVLVMLSSSACLYFGAEDSLNATYPNEFELTVWVEDDAALPQLEQAMTDAGAPYGVNVWEKGAVLRDGEIVWSAAFDTGLSTEQQLALGHAITEALRSTGETWGYSYTLRAEAADDFYGTYGSLFFIGIVLSIMFVCAAVLIIYYKQLCEGYEDQPRFAIMQKVGMTAADIRRSVNSQLLTVFFLPLAGAALHMAFAFPMIRRMLLIFELHNTGLFVATVLISFAVLAAVYTLVYKATSNAYYRIVKGSV